MRKDFGARFVRRVGILVAGVLLAPSAAQAAFHLYDIREVYSSPDGSVQFVELFTANNNQQFLNAHTIEADQGGSPTVFVFPSNGPSPTASTSLLIATASFENACGITPDFILPDDFLFDPNGSVDFASGTDLVNYTSLPLDGLLSLNYPGGGAATNSPENFAGETCSLTAPKPAPALSPAGIVLLALGLGGAVALRRRSF